MKSKIYLKRLISFMMLVTIVSLSISCTEKDESESEMNSSDKTTIPDENKEVVTNTGTLSIYNTAENSSLLITKAIKKISIKPVDADADDIVLTIQSKNLYNGKYKNGYLLYGKKSIRASNSQYYRTTEWFPVLAEQGKSLVLSGTAHNRSTWQFMTADGEILTQAGASQKYKEERDLLQDKTFSKIDIPKDAVSARVYYACFKDEGADSLNNNMQIEYGKIPTNYQSSQQKTVKLPLVEKGSSISLEDGKWNITDNKNTEELDIESLKLQVGDTLTISSSTNCEVQLIWEQDKDIIRTGVYGVRWNLNDSNPVCERVGDASGFHFNAVIGDEPLTPYQNDFDHIYPWSDIKVCAVKVMPDGSRSVTYSGTKDFALDGSAGNIMVRIPKFYCKREVIDDYEYLWISPSKQEGFTVDPSFVTSEGEVDAIYIGAYLSSIKDNKLVSVSQSFPLIKRSFGGLKKLAKNSEGFSECDLLSIMTVQRLYLVETAVLDSQSVFTGNVNMPYLLKDKSTSYYAIKSEKETNRIIVSKTKMTSKFRTGDAVSVISSWTIYHNTEKFQREITEINDMGNDTLEIKFSGNPVDIVERETGITCIPSKNGETDLLQGITGAVSTDSGLSSFKYRGIENLWGNVSIFLDRAYVKNSILYIRYPDNRKVKISYTLPIQNVQLSAKQFGNPTNMIVKRMGFDIDNPLIMFPSEIGNGALTSSYYCDSWYNLAEKDVIYFLTYGGAWDNKGYAGIFNFRATFTKTDAIPFNGSRIMLR